MSTEILIAAQRVDEFQRERDLRETQCGNRRASGTLISILTLTPSLYVTAYIWADSEAFSPQSPQDRYSAPQWLSLVCAAATILYGCTTALWLHLDDADSLLLATRCKEVERPRLLIACLRLTPLVCALPYAAMAVNTGFFICTTTECSGDNVRLVCTSAGMFCSLALVVITHEVRAYVNSVTRESVTSIGVEGIRAIVPIMVPAMGIAFAVACAPCFLNMTDTIEAGALSWPTWRWPIRADWTAFVMVIASAPSVVLVVLVIWSSGHPSKHLPSAEPSAFYPKHLRPVSLFRWMTTWHGIAFTNSCIFAFSVFSALLVERTDLTGGTNAAHYVWLGWVVVASTGLAINVSSISSQRFRCCKYLPTDDSFRVTVLLKIVLMGFKAWLVHQTGDQVLLAVLYGLSLFAAAMMSVAWNGYLAWCNETVLQMAQPKLFIACYCINYVVAKLFGISLLLFAVTRGSCGSSTFLLALSLPLLMYYNNECAKFVDGKISPIMRKALVQTAKERATGLRSCLSECCTVCCMHAAWCKEKDCEAEHSDSFATAESDLASFAESDSFTAQAEGSFRTVPSQSQDSRSFEAESGPTIVNHTDDDGGGAKPDAHAGIGRVVLEHADRADSLEDRRIGLSKSPAGVRAVGSLCTLVQIVSCIGVYVNMTNDAEDDEYDHDGRCGAAAIGLEYAMFVLLAMASFNNIVVNWKPGIWDGNSFGVSNGLEDLSVCQKVRMGLDTMKFRCVMKWLRDTLLRLPQGKTTLFGICWLFASCFALVLAIAAPLPGFPG